ncbi:MAG: PhzF family phenazine biosynthesis protein [Sedimentisphaerales bacterium]|nr:PhzF family phenazine biosynthesis protein [Sedimentisphaerales bacterium]
MKPLTFYIVDVFAERQYAGNQLAVFRDAGGLSDKQMQRIAREMNFSETTFILSDDPRDDGYDVRIFTPVAEVPFAGHPTLGTAYVIRQELLGDPAANVTLNLKVGPIPVTSADRDVLWMKQNQPDFGATIDSEAVASILGLNESDIDARFAVQEVSTGLWFVIVPLTSLDATRRARTTKDKYHSLFETDRHAGILVFCPEAYSAHNDLNVRVFCPVYGIEEDPATGSGNGCLAGYLVKHRYFGSDAIDVRVEQGYEIGRPSLLRLRAGRQDDSIDVNVGGRVVMVAKGQWL